jgi:hypothetical protein
LWAIAHRACYGSDTSRVGGRVHRACLSMWTASIFTHTLSVSMSFTGWLCPRFPNFSLYVLHPAARASSWFPVPPSLSVKSRIPTRHVAYAPCVISRMPHVPRHASRTRIPYMSRHTSPMRVKLRMSFVSRQVCPTSHHVCPTCHVRYALREAHAEDWHVLLNFGFRGSGFGFWVLGCNDRGRCRRWGLPAGWPTAGCSPAAHHPLPHHTYIHTHIFAHIDPRIHAYLHIYIHTHILHISTHISTHTHTRHMRTHANSCTQTETHHMHTQTHANMQKKQKNIQYAHTYKPHTKGQKTQKNIAATLYQPPHTATMFVPQP